MTERLVDVMREGGAVIHTYPVTLDAPPDVATDEDFEARALEAAAHGQLVPNEDLTTLTAQIHVSRAGQLSPYGDDVDSASETKLGLEQCVRERAYFLWESGGRPNGKSEEFWYCALDQHIRERAYVLWEQEGRPAGGQDEYWRRMRDFQS